MTPKPIKTLLQSSALLLVSRILLTFVFWSSGIAKLVDFQGGLGEMAHFGLQPAWLFSILTIIVQLGGSLLVIVNRWTWLGAGALAGFTLLTIPLAHPFWTMQGDQATMEMYVAVEHISVIGALILATILGYRTHSNA